MEAAVQGLSPEQQRELRSQLDQVLSCVASLRGEVAELRGGLQDIAVQIIQDVRSGDCFMPASDITTTMEANVYHLNLDLFKCKVKMI